MVILNTIAFIKPSKPTSRLRGAMVARLTPDQKVVRVRITSGSFRIADDASNSRYKWELGFVSLNPLDELLTNLTNC